MSDTNDEKMAKIRILKNTPEDCGCKMDCPDWQGHNKKGWFCQRLNIKKPSICPLKVNRLSEGLHVIKEILLMHQAKIENLENLLTKHLIKGVQP